MQISINKSKWIIAISIFFLAFTGAVAFSEQTFSLNEQGVEQELDNHSLRFGEVKLFKDSFNKPFIERRAKSIAVGQENEGQFLFGNLNHHR